MTPHPPMHAVRSTNVAAVGYDSETREIYVEFRNGRVYVYGNASEATFEALLHAGSVGRYLNREIKPRHPCRQL